MSRLLRAALVSAVGLLLLEAAARLVPLDRLPRRADGAPPSDRPSLMQPDPTRIFRFPEGEVRLTRLPARIDADGQRIPVRPGPADAPLILTLGDSSVWGHGVPDGQTLHDQLQRELGLAGVPARVQTLATPGYTTVQTRVVLDEVGWARDPALLVVANLWSDAHLDRYRDRDVLAARSPLDRSALFGLLRWAVDSARGRPTAARRAWPTAADAGVRRVRLDDYRDQLHGILEDARARGVGAVVLGLPHISWVVAGAPTAGAAVPYLEVLRATAEAHRVPFVDGTAAFVAEADRSHLFSDGLHPAGRGHLVLARALGDRLRAEGWPAEPLVPAAAPAPVPVPPDPYDGAGYAAAGSLRNVVEPDTPEPVVLPGLRQAPAPAASRP